MTSVSSCSQPNFKQLGREAFELAQEMWDFPRTLAGPGFLKSLNSIESYVGEPLKRTTFKSGQKVFDWTVPDYWVVSEAYILTPNGDKICDFSQNNLYLVGYSLPYEGHLSKSELDKHLHSIPAHPHAIPYVTAYYAETWGFCIEHNRRLELEEGNYQVIIRTQRLQGEMTIGEYVLQGSSSSKEVFLSTYLCHPSMANNELSGPVVSATLAKMMKDTNRKRSFRFVFLPETIGSIAYLSQNIERMKSTIIAGFVLTCVGDNRNWSLLPSRAGASLSEKSARRILKKEKIGFKEIDWLERGSDERQYCAPGVDLPIASLMRSKYGTYPEYHTSLDTLGKVVTSEGLSSTLRVYYKLLNFLNESIVPMPQFFCEPNLGSRDLYPLVSDGSVLKSSSRTFLDFLSFCDGTNSLEDIEDRLGIDSKSSHAIFFLLRDHGLLKDS